ncbi:molybdenum cofactor guanylyltransferase [Alteromonas sp. H39]|uniref:molybdenum cofactor guanylyltransferase n=1 Tax=Alteromonas sp. H39 TaxID=3389876 RepID=UPI0039DF607E
MSLETDNIPPVSGFILAGGRSSRMGRDKADVKWQGVSLLNHMKMTLSTVAPRIFVVGGRYADIPDLAPFLGPGNAIANQLLMMPASEHIAVFVPIDMPGLTPALLRYLIGQSQIQGAPVYFDSHYLPVAIPTRNLLLDKLRELLSVSPEPSVKSVLQRIGARSLVSAGNDMSFANINRPEDLKALADR